MYINQNIVNYWVKARDISLQTLLKAADVSSNAYYSLSRKKSVLPKSVLKIARVLDIPPTELLIDEEALTKEHIEVAKEVDFYTRGDPSLDPGTVRLTLELLKLSPLERLQKGLQFGK